MAARYLTLLLLTALCLSCSNNNDDTPPKTPQEMILGEWRRTHSSYTAPVNNIVELDYLYSPGQSPASNANFTISPDGTMRMLSQDDAHYMPRVEGGGTYGFTTTTLDFDLYWQQYDIRSIQKHEILVLTDDELIVKLYYAKRNDDDDFGTLIPRYYRYSRNWPSAEDKNFKFNLVTKEKS